MIRRAVSTDGRAQAVGATGAAVVHSSMALVNVAYNLSYGWQHPRVTTLEAQMRQPLLNRHPVEIGLAGREREVVAAARGRCDLSRGSSRPCSAAPSARRRSSPPSQPSSARCIDGHSAFDAYVFGGSARCAVAGSQARHGAVLLPAHRLRGLSLRDSIFQATGATAAGPPARPASPMMVWGWVPCGCPRCAISRSPPPICTMGASPRWTAVLDHYQRVGNTA